MKDSFSNPMRSTGNENQMLSDIILRSREYGNQDLVIGNSDAQLLQNISDLAFLKSQIKELEVKEKLLEKSLKESIGNRERVVFNGVVIATLKEFTREVFDTKRLKLEFPDVHKKFSGLTNYKMLKVKEVVSFS